MSKKVPIRIRPAIEADVNFIFNSWLKSYRNSHFSRFIANEMYYHGQHQLIEHLIRTNKVSVACSDSDPTQLYGYICGGFEQGFLVIHYAYVKHQFRNFGIGKELLNSFEQNDNVGLYTHHTKIAERLAPKFNFHFNPYLVFNYDEFVEVEK